MKRITKIFVVLAMVLSISNISKFEVSAETTYTTLTSKLDLTDKTGDNDDVDASDTYGYYWDSSELTLYVYGLTIDTTETCGIYLPDGTTIVLEGDLSVVADNNDGHAIHCLGDLKISGDGNMYLKSNVSAISTLGSLTMTVGGDLELIAGMYVIDPGGSVDIESNGELTITGSSGIFTWDQDVKLTLNGVSTINCSTGMLVGSGDLTIGGTGDQFISSIEAYGNSVVLEGTIEITSNYFKCSVTPTIGENVVLNTFLTVCEDDWSSTIYGNFIPESGDVFNLSGDEGTLSFTEGSSLTIPSDMTVNLSAFDIDFTNANIIVEEGGSVDFGGDYEHVYYTIIDSFTVADIFVGEDIVHNINVSLEDSDYMPVNGDYGVPGDITYTYSTSEDGTYTLTVPTTAGTYYVKATVATNVGDDYVTTSTSSITDFEIIAVPSGSTEDGDGDADVDGNTETNGEADTNGEVDGVVDTGDTNNVLLFTTLSVCAVAFILVDMKKRAKV